MSVVIEQLRQGTVGDVCNCKECNLKRAAIAELEALQAENSALKGHIGILLSEMRNAGLNETSRK